MLVRIVFISINTSQRVSLLRYLDLRRDTYEDYTFPLKTVANFTGRPQAFDLHSLRNFAKHNSKIIIVGKQSLLSVLILLEERFSHDAYVSAERELRDDANMTYHTNIGWATRFEILATVLIFIVTGATFLLGSMLRSDST